MIRDKLKADSVQALKNHESVRVETLRFLISLIDKKELQLPVGQMSESDEVVVLRKELKNKDESRGMFLRAGRDDLVKQLDYEIDVLREYLPEDVDESKVAEIVSKVIEEKGTNFGLVMKEVMLRFNGAVDGGVVAKVVKDKISNS